MKSQHKSIDLFALDLRNLFGFAHLNPLFNLTFLVVKFLAGTCFLISAFSLEPQMHQTSLARQGSASSSKNAHPMVMGGTAFDIDPSRYTLLKAAGKGAFGVVW
jgi:hypothetical protein